MNGIKCYLSILESEQRIISFCYSNESSKVRISLIYFNALVCRVKIDLPNSFDF
jgi:hypothetical protein